MPIFKNDSPNAKPELEAAVEKAEIAGASGGADVKYVKPKTQAPHGTVTVTTVGEIDRRIPAIKPEPKAL